MSISGLGETAALDLARCKEREARFISIEELGRACPQVSQSHLEQLKALGALGDMPETSQINLFDFLIYPHGTYIDIVGSSHPLRAAAPTFVYKCPNIPQKF